MRPSSALFGVGRNAAHDEVDHLIDPSVVDPIGWADGGGEKGRSADQVEEGPGFDVRPRLTAGDGLLEANI
jgi:hypothetical protein